MNEVVKKAFINKCFKAFIFRNSIRDAGDRDPTFKRKLIEFYFEQYICLQDDIKEQWMKNGFEWPFEVPPDMSFTQFRELWDTKD